MNIATGEPLVEDKRLWTVAEKIGVIFPELPRIGYELVTWIQEPVPFNDATLPRVACFAVISPHPKDKNRERLTRGAIWYDDWDEAEKVAGHYAGAGDPLLKFFKPIIRAHLESLKNSEELID